MQPSLSCHGVARPRALSGLRGTISVQFRLFAASDGDWFRLMTAPVESTGLASARSGYPASGFTAGALALVVGASLGHGAAEAARSLRRGTPTARRSWPALTD